MQLGAGSIITQGDDTLIPGTTTQRGQDGDAIFIHPGADDVTVDLSGGRIETSGLWASGVTVSGDRVEVNLSGSDIETSGEGGLGIEFCCGATDGTLNFTGGSITVSGIFTAGVHFIGSINTTINMSGGSINTTGDSAAGISSYARTPEKRTTVNPTLDLSGGAITTTGDESHGVSLLPLGDADMMHYNRLTTRRGHTISTSGAGSHGVYVRDTPDESAGVGGVNTATTELRLGGIIEVSGMDAWGVLLEDATGGVETFEVSGIILGDTADTGTGGAIWDNSGLGTTLTVRDAAQVIGKIDLGAGDDALTVQDTAQVIGDIDLGAGDDTLTLTGTNIAGSAIGSIAGGADNDHLNYASRTEDIIIVALTGSDETGFAGEPVVAITLLPGHSPSNPQVLPTFVNGDFSGVDQLTGGTGTDSLTGMADAAATWTLRATGNTYAVMRVDDMTGQTVTDTLTFSGFQVLEGGSMAADAFTIGAAFNGGIQGDDGDDTFTFEDGGSIGFDLNGGDGVDTLISDDDGITFTVTGMNEGQMTDSAGTALIANGFTGIENLSGGAGMDTFNINAELTGSLDGGGGDDVFNIAASITGDVVGGDGDDRININMGGSVMGDIDTGAGNDEITLEGNAQITGDINLGEGDDTLTFASADVRFVGLADGGAGTDTLNGLDIFTDAMPTTLFRYTNFETVNGEDALLANLPVIRMETTESGGAMRTLIAYVDAPPPAPAMPDTDGADGDADMMGGGQPDSSAGGTDTDTDTATPTPPPPADNVQIAAELSRTYGGEITPLNADGDAPAEVEAYLFVDPTGPAAQAASVGALSTTVNTVVNQRLSGSVPGGGGSRRTARPVQLAAGALLPGLLAGGSDPLIWGELFASDRRRGRDGLNLAHGHDYRGVVFGAEQGYEGEQYRLGLLFGYADADTNTHLRSLDIETGSVFGGLYGRIAKESIDINLGLNLGYEFHDNRRYIPQLDTEAEADYNSFFINPWLGLSRTWSLQDNLELRPAFLLNYTFARYEGYEERGGEGFAIDVGSRIAHNLSTRAQVAGVWTLPDTGNELGLRLGLEGRLAGGGDFKGSLGGSSFSYSDTGDKRATSVFIGIDGRHAFSDELTLQVDVEYSHDLGGVSERTLGGFVRLEYEY